MVDAAASRKIAKDRPIDGSTAPSWEKALLTQEASAQRYLRERRPHVAAVAVEAALSEENSGSLPAPSKEEGRCNMYASGAPRISVAVQDGTGVLG